MHSKLEKRKVTNFQYVGLVIEQSEKSIILRQKHVDEMEDVMLFDKRNRNADEPLNMRESRELKAVAGQLSCLASQTRPDVSFDALELNIIKNKSTEEKANRAKKAVRMLKRSKAK